MQKLPSSIFSAEIAAQMVTVASKGIFSYTSVGSLDNFYSGTGDPIEDLDDFMPFEQAFNIVRSIQQEVLNAINLPNDELIAWHIKFNCGEVWVG